MALYPNSRARERVLQRTSIFTMLAFAIVGCQVGTDQNGRTVMSTPTLGRALGSSQQRSGAPAMPVAMGGTVQEQRTVAGRTVRIISSGNGHVIAVDGRVLANDTEDDRVVIQGVYQGGGRAYMLISEQSGGTACPSMYQVLDLSGSIPIVSPQFGNCSDLPRTSVVDRALSVSVPAFRAAPAKVFMFREGHLRS